MDNYANAIAFLSKAYRYTVFISANVSLQTYLDNHSSDLFEENAFGWVNLRVVEGYGLYIVRPGGLLSRQSHLLVLFIPPHV